MKSGWWTSAWREVQRKDAEVRNESLRVPFLCVSLRLCAKAGLASVAAWPRCGSASSTNGSGPPFRYSFQPCVLPRGSLTWPCMSSKELVLELVRKLPEEASMLDIAHEIEFVAGIREAMDEFDRGESITAEELLSEIPKWARNTR